MTPSEYARVKEIFAKAIALPANQRDAYVHAECADDELALREVESLLEHHREETVLEESDSEPTIEKGIVVTPPSEADPYLVQKDVWEDNRQVLRRRLLIIACSMAFLIAISLIELFTDHYREWGYGVRILALVVSLICASILHLKHNLTLTQIRIAEAVVMTNVGLLAIVIDVRLMLFAVDSKTGETEAATLISANNWNYFTWTLIIFVYGVFMPNRWQRAAAVMLPMAMIPILVTWLAEYFSSDNVAEILAKAAFGTPALMPFAAAIISIFAAHSIHGARLSAFQARRLAQYRILRLIGQGGMGQVYEAEHLLLKRNCAVKLIQPEKSSDDRALRRFEREVRATAALTHPHTIEVYDYGQTNEDVFFFAMELLPGMNLRDLVKAAGPLPPGRAVHFLVDVCDALREAHDAGMVHRDIKPANIFASERGGIYDFTKLLDFGVVREIEVDNRLSNTFTMVAGTPSFMSPEQATSPEKLDPRSDIYALGAVAFYLLTGRPPFVGKSPMQIMLAHVGESPQSPREFRPDLPADLEAVVMRCLAKDVNDRTPSAKQLLQELLRCECAGKWTQEMAITWWKGQPGTIVKDVDVNALTRIASETR
ncbi:MAG: serine/threonine-protein kinase [Rubripirellula sp.]